MFWVFLAITACYAYQNEKLVEEVNAQKPGWVAGENAFFKFKELDEIKTLFGLFDSTIFYNPRLQEGARATFAWQTYHRPYSRYSYDFRRCHKLAQVYYHWYHL
jgi:hypothetical protein